MAQVRPRSALEREDMVAILAKYGAFQGHFSSQSSSAGCSRLNSKDDKPRVSRPGVNSKRSCTTLCRSQCLGMDPDRVDEANCRKCDIRRCSPTHLSPQPEVRRSRLMNRDCRPNVCARHRPRPLVQAVIVKTPAADASENVNNEIDAAAGIASAISNQRPSSTIAAPPIRRSPIAKRKGC